MANHRAIKGESTFILNGNTPTKKYVGRHYSGITSDGLEVIALSDDDRVTEENSTLDPVTDRTPNP